jgi:hypothetical protein
MSTDFIIIPTSIPTRNMLKGKRGLRRWGDSWRFRSLLLQNTIQRHIFVRYHLKKQSAAKYAIRCVCRRQRIGLKRKDITALQLLSSSVPGRIMI